jgi:hypothetical protein
MPVTAVLASAVGTFTITGVPALLECQQLKAFQKLQSQNSIE